MTRHVRNPLPDPRTTGESPELARVAVAVGESLRRSGYLSLADLACKVEGGALVLRGRVRTYYLKQVAWEVASEVAGGCGLVDEVAVGASPAGPPVARAARTGSMMNRQTQL